MFYRVFEYYGGCGVIRLTPLYVRGSLNNDSRRYGGGKQDNSNQDHSGNNDAGVGTRGSNLIWKERRYNWYLFQNLTEYTRTTAYKRGKKKSTSRSSDYLVQLALLWDKTTHPEQRRLDLESVVD